MTKLTDLFGDEGCGCTKDFSLEALVAAGYVRTQRHPSLPYTIYNYTAKTQFEKAWNVVTRQCRGLIAHDDGTVVARPFPKFFNWGERPEGHFNQDAVVTVTDKADGSLGILYPTPGIGNGWSIATRGSFTSEQAIEGSIMLSDLYGDWTPPSRFGEITVLFEIIYPQNWIVLDYGERRELRLIDAVWNEPGWPPLGSDPNVVANALGWPGPVVEHLGTTSLKIALHDLVRSRENREGVVLRFLDTEERWKIKQDDYVALHRVLTGTSARVIWQYLAVNACAYLIKEPKHWGSRLGIDPKRAAQIQAVGPQWLDKLLESVPDEFYDWVRATSERIRREVADTWHELESTLSAARQRVSREGLIVDHRARLYQVLRELSPEHHGAAMAMHDHKDATTYCWKSAYPGAENPFRTISEDAA